MASTAVTPQDPMDFFPFRGQYGGSTMGATLFVAVRASVPAIFYALLAPPTTSLSLFSKFPSAYPAIPPPTNGPSIPLLPDAYLQSLSESLGLSPYASLMFLGATLPSLSFAMYNLIWRREKFPMTGQGGSIQVTTQVNLIDILHAFLFVYLASRNPTWSPYAFKWTPMIFLAGLALHVAADHSKYLFRRKPKNRGKVLRTGVWSLVRHPNFVGFTIWRVAFATAAGGWAFGLSLLVGFCYLFHHTSIPILETYMAEKYGNEWKLTTEKVRWKMIPGIW